MGNFDHLHSEQVFRFKKFSLTDKNCAMKIGTDSVLLGSVAARIEASQVLDIGTGCGLLAMMIAQQSPGEIVAIDQDLDAVITARSNIAASAWSDRITVAHSRFQDFCMLQEKKFDLIVCNPPFFHNSLKNSCHKKTMARHSDSLQPNELMSGSSYLLSENGKLLIIVPFDQENLWLISATGYGLGCVRRVEISPREGASPNRVILEFSPGNFMPISESLSIRTEANNSFSPVYRQLISEYYLGF